MGKILTLLAAAALLALPARGGVVSVAYAGSLVRTMEGPFSAALLQRTGVRMAGEPDGSKALAALIRAGLRTPDVFLCADPRLLRGIARGTVFGTAQLVLAYSTRSPHRALFQRVARGPDPLLRLLANPAITLGRTDPQLDPKGAITLAAIAALGRSRPGLAATVRAKSQVFPEADLAVRVESGELDAGFFYTTEIAGRGLRAIAIPIGPAGTVRYAIAQLPNAPHPAQARAFIDFLLHGDGRRILQRAGIRFLAHPARTPE